MKIKKSERPLSTSDEIENDQRSKKVKETEDFIFSRIKYLKGLDWYDILDEKTYKRMMDQLSVNGSGQPCDDELSSEIFNECPKQLRGGVKIQSIVEVVARKINDAQMPKEKQDKLQKVFIATNAEQPKPRYWSVLRYICRYICEVFGLHKCISYLEKKKSGPTSKSIGLGTQSILQTQYSSGSNLRSNNFPLQSVVHSVNMPNFVGNQQVLGGFDKNTEIHIKSDLNAGYGATAVSEHTEEKGSILGQGLRSMFFMRNDVSRKMEFSFGNTMSSLFHIIPIGYMLFLLLKGQGSEDSSQNGSKSYKEDKFYL